MNTLLIADLNTGKTLNKKAMAAIRGGRGRLIRRRWRPRRIWDPLTPK